MQRADRIASILFIIISIIFGYQAIKLPGPIGGRGIGPGGFPFVICIGLFICALFLLFRSRIQELVEERKFSLWPRMEEKKNFYIVLGATFAYPAAILVFGYVICTFFFLFFLIRVLGKYRWTYVGLISVFFAIFLYYAFRVWFYMPLPKGFFW